MRLIYRILLAVAVSGLILISTLYLALFHFGLIENLANRTLRDIIGEKLPLSVHIQEISGNMFSELTVRQLDVLYKDSAFTYIMATIPEFSFKYSIKDFWQNHIAFEQIFIDSAEITLMQSPGGEWLIPQPEKGESGTGTELNFEIDELGLNKLKVNLLRAADTLTFDDIIFRAHLIGRDGTYSMDIDGMSYISSDERLNLSTAGGKITLSKKDLLFQSVFIMTDSSDIMADGHVVFGDSVGWKINLEAENINIAEASDFLGPNLRGNIKIDGDIEFEKGIMSGQVQLAGDFMDREFDSLHTKFSMINNILTFDTLHGIVLGGCAINAGGYMDLSIKPEQYRLEGTIDGFNLEHVVRGSFESNLSGSLILEGSGLKNKNMTLDVDIDMGKSEFDIIAPHMARGHMTITTDSIVFDDNFTLGYYENHFIFSGRVNYQDELYLDGTAHFEDLSRFDGLIFIETLGGRGDASYTVTGKTNDPDLMGYIKSDSLWLYEVFSDSAILSCNIERFMGQRHGKSDVRLYDGNAYQLPFNTLELDLNIDSQFVYMSRVYMDNSFATALASGDVEYMTDPMHLKLDTAILTLFDQPVVSKQPILIDIDSLGYTIAQCRLNPSGGALNANGRYNFDESIDFKVNAQTVEIAPWVRLFTEEYQIYGIVSGDADINGTLGEPLIDYKGKIDSLVYAHPLSGKELNLDLYTAFDYSDQRINIDSLYLKTRGGYFTANGYFPINLALENTPDRFPDAEQSIEIYGIDSTYDLILMYMPEVERMEGQFEASIKLTGQSLTPNIDGQASIRDGWLKPYDLVLPLEHFNLDLEMKDKTITIKEASAICRDGNRELGKLKAEGTVEVLSLENLDYNLKVAIEEFPAEYELGDISAVVSGDLVILGETPPTVYGDVELLQAFYRENFAEEDEGWLLLSTLGDDNTWNLNLNVEIPSNTWVKNSELDAELSGSLNFLRTDNAYRYIGQLEILRGKGYMADRTFRIDPGGTITYDDVEYPNPMIDLYATTKIRGVSDEIDQFGEPRSKSYDLCIHITETMDNPEINPCDDSQFSREEILSLIFTNYYAGSNGYGSSESVIGDRLGTFATGLVGSQMSQIGTRTLSNIGVETFEIDPVYGDKFEPLGTKVGLGFSLHPNLYVYGRSAISGVEGQELGFEYRLRRFLLVEGRLDEHNLYHLLLNFSWDY